jgi:hypothetical protein
MLLKRETKQNKSKEAKGFECYKTWRKIIEVLTSGEALKRMQNNIFGCENSTYCQ